jgi:putative phage-type endonuclease
MLTREEWLEERRKHLGASDCAAVLGASPFAGAFEIYHSKVTGDNQEDNDRLKFGRDVERAIANMFEAKSGMKTIDPGDTAFLRHPKYDWLVATLDRKVFDEELNVWCPGELKHVGGFERPDEWVADPPLYNQIQLQIQMACMDVPVGYLIGLFPGYNLRWTRLQRNDAFLEISYPIFESFMDQVKRREPPTVSGPKCLDLVKRLYPTPNGSTVDLSNDVLMLAREWDTAKVAAREATSRVKEIEAELRLRIGDAETGEMSDGSILVRKTINRKGYTVEPTSFDQIYWKKPKK